MTLSREVQAQRQREFDAAQTRGQVEALLARWQAEDAAPAGYRREGDGTQFGDKHGLEDRVARLEKVVAPGGPLCAGISDVIRTTVQTLRREMRTSAPLLNRDMAQLQPRPRIRMPAKRGASW